jgi:hypothetical protein
MFSFRLDSIIRFFVVLLQFSLLGNTTFGVQKSLSPEEVELCGVVEYGPLNADAWLNGNFSTIKNTVVDNVTKAGDGTLSGVFVETHVFQRCAFDYEKRRFANYEVVQRKTIDFDSRNLNEPSETVTVSWQAGCVNFKTGEYHSNSNSDEYFNSALHKDLNSPLHRIRFTDYRACWSLNPLGERTLVEEKRRAASNKNGIGIQSVLKKNGETVLKIDGRMLNFPELEGPFYTRRYDSRTSMPTFIGMHYRYPGRPEKVSATHKHVQWNEIDGIFVPKSIVGRHSVHHLIRQKKYTAMADHSTKFDWHSLNTEKMDPRFFDGTFVRDFKTEMATILPAVKMKNAETKNEFGVGKKRVAP